MRSLWALEPKRGPLTACLSLQGPLALQLAGGPAVEEGLYLAKLRLCDDPVSPLPPGGALHLDSKASDTLQLGSHA